MSKEEREETGPARASLASQLVDADPYLVAFSPTNPRKRKGLDIDSLNALAASIKAQGLAQPILVRPLPGTRAADTFQDREEGRPLPTYELVCGERRLRASRFAELPTIPMLVRDLDDEAALELQLVENIEREDLDPMEEAEGFELLRTKLGYTVEQIGERIAKGKGESYIYKTLKLLALTPESREAMYEGHLGRSTGLLVARYPAEKQAEVVAYIKSLATSGEPAPWREVSPKVHQRFNLVLTAAVWDLADAQLVPAAGACAACPKRTGANADLFGDVNGPDSCTDAVCFAGKRQAHVDRTIADAKKQGLQVIDGDDAKKAIPSPWQSWVGGGYTRVDGTAVIEPCDDDQEREVTFEDLLRAKGKKAPKPMVLINPHTGAAIKVIPQDVADKLQEEAEKKLPQQPQAGKRGREEDVDDRPEDVKALDHYDIRRGVLLRVFDSIRNRDRTDGDMLLIAKALFVSVYADDPLESLENYLSWSDLPDADDPEALLQQKLEAMPAAELAAVLTMAAAELVMTRHGFPREKELALAAQYGIDVLAVRDKVAEDLDRDDGQEEDHDEANEDAVASNAAWPFPPAKEAA